jgi:hypothetical protein
MNGDDHLAGLGKLMGNLQSLELCLRIFLAEAAGENWHLPASQGTSVPENSLTNWDAFGTLISKYNKGLSAAELPLYSVDSSVVQARDALAHGRLCAPIEAFPLTLWRFGKPDKSGIVPVEQVAELSIKWFEKWRTLTREQMDRVSACAVARGHKSLSA